MRIKMINKIEKKIISLDIKYIFKLPKLVFTVLMLVILLIFFLSLNNSNVLVDIVLYLLITLVAVSGILINKFIASSVRLILTENIDLEKYQDYFDYAYSHSNKSQAKNLKQLKKISEGQVLYLKGKWIKSLEVLNSINNKQNTVTIKSNYMDIADYYSCLSYIKLGNYKTVEKYLTNLSDKNSELVNAILKVEHGETTQYFESLNPETHLQLIIKHYYSALNELNSENKGKAKEWFQTIATENPELFYVREARQYLEEN